MRAVIVTYTLILYSAGMSNMPAPPLPRLASIDRSQLLLHTVDVERLIDEDHRTDESFVDRRDAHFVRVSWTRVSWTDGTLTLWEQMRVSWRVSWTDGTLTLWEQMGAKVRI